MIIIKNDLPIIPQTEIQFQPSVHTKLVNNPIFLKLISEMDFFIPTSVRICGGDQNCYFQIQ